MKESKIVHALIVKEVWTVDEEKKAEEVPGSVKGLLEEFKGSIAGRLTRRTASHEGHPAPY